MKWFVHIDERYYPSGVIVDADSPSEAIEAAWLFVGHTLNRPKDDRDGVAFAVCPLEHVHISGPPEAVARFTEE